MTYQIDLGVRVKRYQTFHVNCMRKWNSPSAAVFLAETDEWEDLEEEEERVNINTIMSKPHLV